MISIGEPITGIALGAGLNGEHVALAAVRLVGEVLALAAMMAGLILISRSPLVDDGARPGRA